LEIIGIFIQYLTNTPRVGIYGYREDPGFVINYYIGYYRGVVYYYNK